MRAVLDEPGDVTARYPAGPLSPDEVEHLVEERVLEEPLGDEGLSSHSQTPTGVTAHFYKGTCQLRFNCRRAQVYARGIHSGGE